MSLTTTPFDPVFRESCVDINKADCASNTRLINPCSCTKYYLCDNNKMVDTNCPKGTAYDHTASAAFCKQKTEVYLSGICNETSPWTRCKATSGVTDSKLTEIEARCTGHRTTNQPSNDSTNVGVIVGGVIGGVLVIVLVTICYAFYKRGYIPTVSIKKKEINRKHPLRNQPSITNPQYFGETDYNIYEQYSTIDDTMHEPQYSHAAPKLPERPPSIQSNPTGTGSDRKISVTSVQSYMEPSPSLKYGFDNNGLDLREENGTEDRFYTEIFPDYSSNGHITLQRTADDCSPYDNTLHV